MILPDHLSPLPIPEPFFPSDKVRTYYMTNLYSDWKSDLDFLLSSFPQVEDGQLQYLIEGSTAVRLLKPDSGRHPHDIDVASSEGAMAQDFYGSKGFDVKSAAYWFKLRNLPYSLKKREVLFESPVSVGFRDHQVLVLNPVHLAASKSPYLPFNNWPKRQSDKNDIKLLGVSDEEMMKFVSRLSLA